MTRARRFDEASLAAAGLAVVRDGGWAAVTVRAVADRLGVTPMALYRVAPDAEHLRRLVADAAAPAVVAVAGAGLVEVLGAWALDAHGQLRGLPGLAGHVVGHWIGLPRLLDVVEALLGVAAADGLEGTDAVAAVNAVFAYVLVRAQLHDAIAAAPPRRLGPLRDEPARYPLLRRNRGEFARARVEHHFRHGL